jgi:hypothetical protein
VVTNATSIRSLRMRYGTTAACLITRAMHCSYRPAI